MPSCTNYFGKLFAHLAAALAISAVSSETSNLGVTIYGNTSVLIQFLGNLAIMFGLLFGIYHTKPGGLPKYIFFGAFAFWIGQVIKPYVSRLKDKGTLTRILALTTGVFVGMMALGFYDSMNLLGFGPYLFAGLVGLIIAQLLLIGFGTPQEKKEGFKFLNFFGVALFAAFTAYDVQVLRAGAASCRSVQKKFKRDPDYPAESLDLYLDFINLFGRLGRIGNED
jgi:FtsH-binding integral membrane protein